MNTPMFKSGDKILILALALTAAFFMVWNTMGTNTGKNLTAVVTHDSKLVQKIDLRNLDKPLYIDLNEEGIHQTILAEKGRIRFLKSDCPNKTCVKTGWLTRPGARAICLPSRVSITMVGDNKQVDVLAY